MKHMAMALLMGAGIFAAASQSGLAQAMHSSSMMMTMPKCATGDQVVGVNMTTKMYMTHDQMKAKMSGMSASQDQAMMAKNHMKLMCKSQADAMGAKMMKPPM